MIGVDTLIIAGILLGAAGVFLGWDFPSPF